MGGSTLSLVCFLLLITSNGTPVVLGQTTLTVLPNDHCTVTGEPCDTLDMYLRELSSNTTLILSEGTHVIEELNIIEGVSNISIVGESGPSQVKITCANGTGLVFFEIFGLEFANFTIEGCGVKYLENDIINKTQTFIDIFYVSPPQLSAAVTLVGVVDLHVHNLAVVGNFGFGLIGINVIGNSLISDTNFTSNTPKTCIVELASEGGSGGGAFFLYHDFLNDSSSLQFNEIQFSRLTFLRNVVKNNFICRLDLFSVLYTKLSRSISVAEQQDFNITGAGGISVILAQRSYHTSVFFNSSLFQNNSASYNGAALMALQFEGTDDCHVRINDCQFLNNGGGLVSEYGSLAADPAGALLAGFYLRTPQELAADIVADFIVHEPSSVSVTNSEFRHNMAINGGAMAVFSFGPAIGVIQDQLFVLNCTFAENKGAYGAVAFITELSYSGFEPGLVVYFEDITVVNNSRRVSFAPGLRTLSGIFDISLLNVFFNGSNVFSGNLDTPLHTYSGIVSMTGNNVFEHNTGFFGGAMHFASESYLVLTGDANVTLQHNRGLLAGGAIFVNFQTIRPNVYDCFLFFEEYNPFCSLFHSCNLSSYQATLRLIQNIAPMGSAIFGSTLSSCPWGLGNSSIGDPLRLISNETVNQTISFLNGLAPLIIFDPPIEQNKMIINTVPRVILPENSDLIDNIAVMPGQEFEASIGTFDELHQPVTLAIFSELSPLEGTNTDEAHSSIGETDSYLLTSTEQDSFDRVPVTIFGNKNQRFNVTILSQNSNVDLNISVFLTDCAVGFSFDNESHACKCSLNGTISSVQCMSNGTISYPVNAWIGLDPEGNYIIHDCLQDYCQAGITNLNLSTPDDQCDNNRHGILCGECQPGYSRVFGSTRCRKCTTNAYLALILVFAILGILLVMTISFFNVTITDGYINGFIFYSNIVSFYLSEFLPLSQQNATVIFVLIAFFNLDFGIETCFYTGMNELGVVGLQFIFPFYLALLLLGITFVTKHWSRINAFRNFKVTHVFATLLLISYGSIIRTSIEVLGFTQLISSEGIHTVWRSDPNVPYFTRFHGFLSILSILLLIVLIPLPFPLLFPTLIFKVPKLKLAKLKPLLDAFVAPFGTNRRFWLGFRLLWRLVLFCVAYLGTQDAQLVAITALLAILMVVQAYLKPYSTPGRNILDLSFILNLNLLSIVSLYLRPKTLKPGSEDNIQYAAAAFTSIACAQLLLLLLYYFIKAFESSYTMWKTVKGKMISKWETVQSRFPSISEGRVSFKSSRNSSSGQTLELHPASSTHSSVYLEASEAARGGFGTVDFIGYREALVDQNGPDEELISSL